MKEEQTDMFVISPESRPPHHLSPIETEPSPPLPGADVDAIKAQMASEAHGYEVMLAERMRALEMQHEDNLRQTKERMQEEILRNQEESDARSRDRIDQLEKEKAAYEQRLRDKYADMVKELEDRSRSIDP